MDHHREIDVVEVAEPQQLGLAPQELELALARLVDAPFDVAVLLRGHREEDQAPRQLVERARVAEPDRGAEQPGDLRVVAARVRGAARGVGLGMARDDQRVQLAEQRERRPVAAARSIRAHAGHREAGLRREADLAERLLDEPRRLHFLEPELGVTANLLAEADDLVATAIDRREHPLLELVSRHVPFSFVAMCRRGPL